MPNNEWIKHGELLGNAGGVEIATSDDDLDGVGLCLVLGGTAPCCTPSASRGIAASRWRG